MVKTCGVKTARYTKLYKNGTVCDTQIGVPFCNIGKIPRPPYPLRLSLKMIQSAALLVAVLPQFGKPPNGRS